MRDYLAAHSVEFDDRNIRQSGRARAELLELTGELVVPYLVYGGRRVVGFDPGALDEIAQDYRSRAGALRS